MKYLGLFCGFLLILVAIAGYVYSPKSTDHPLPFLLVGIVGACAFLFSVDDSSSKTTIEETEYTEGDEEKQA